MVQSGAKIKARITLEAFADILLDESSSQLELREVLNQFADLCAHITGITPDATFLGWSDDIHLASGVAINPQAAAHCVNDYGRSVAFIRGVHAAIQSLQTHFLDQPLKILYAGCGPFATLIMAILVRFRDDPLELHFLDVHTGSLESVQQLITYFGFDSPLINLINADASTYQHPDAPHLIIAETMQKALEQEPQVAVTVNLVPQLHSDGVFIPERITVDLGLADLSCGSSSSSAHMLGTLLNLTTSTLPLSATERPEETAVGSTLFQLGDFAVPALEDLAQLDLTIFTHIQVFSNYHLRHYESEITLPLKYHDIEALHGGDRLHVTYELGTYPRFCIAREY